MHLCDGSLGVLDFLVENVGSAAVDIVCPELAMAARKTCARTAQQCRHTNRIERHLQVFDGAICSKDLAQVAFIDILGQLLNDNLWMIRLAQWLDQRRFKWRTFALRRGGEPLLLLGLLVKLLGLLRERDGERDGDLLSGV